MRVHRRPLAVLVVVCLAVAFQGALAGPAAARERSGGTGAGKAKGADLATLNAKRWIVQLDGGALTQRVPRTGRLDVASAASQSALADIRVQQDQFRTRLAAAVPSARVQRSYEVVLNGLAVAMNSDQAATVRAMSGVRAVTPDVAFHRDMYATPQQIGAPAAWEALGGQATAGSGVKVAIIDSGIYVTYDGDAYAGNPCFDDTGYTAPSGYPRGETAFTNDKVIVARSYFRPDDPPKPGEETALPGPGDNSHGSHVAGTVACNAGTAATVQGTEVMLSGIAPHAYLMNYRVFYESVSPEDFQNGNAYVAELVQAMEDAVSDGADVVSSSWGSSYQNTLSWPDPMVQAAESAVDAGVTMVFAQGNEGPGEETGNLPGNSPKVIAVGAVTKNTTISPGRVTAKDGDNADVPGTPFDVGPSGFGPQDPGNIASTAYAPVETVDPGSSPLACDPLPATSLDGKIAVISRGTCDFSLKVYNAQQAGAVAAFVYNSAANGNNLQAMGPGEHAADVTIPSFFLRRSNGLALVNATPGGTAAYTKDSHVAENIGDVVAGFSSRGPSAGKQIKPDLAAPGVDVVSAGYNGTVFPEKYTGFGSASGTSMATPHVAGAAALLKALHPAWTPAQVKSALMNTATDQVFLDTAHSNQAGVLDRGAGRIDLSEAIDPGLSLDVPSVSAGERPAGTGQTTAVKATNLDPGVQTWSLSTDVDTAGLNIDLSKSTLTAGPGGTAAFNVTLSTESGAEPGDYEGSVVLENLTAAKTLHIPVFLRVVVDAPTTDVLLVDDDGSAAADGFADYASFYQGLLEDLGLSYDYIEPWNDGFLPLGMLKEYRTVLLFTGENDSWDTSGFFVEDQDALNAYLNGGGRLLAMGQNLAETTDSNTDFDSPRIGRSRLYHGYLGIEQDAANSYPVGAPRPTATGANWLDGMTLDLTPGGNAAGGQDSIEATSPMPNTDTYSAAHAVSTILAAAPGGAVPAGAAFGHTKSSEPSLEETRQEFLYRTLSLGFGLEGLRSDTGHTSASALADKAFKWAFDEVTASINGGAFSSAEPVTLTAEASSTKGTVDQFRWDFGDGTPFATTEGPSASHRYAKGGTYPVRLEVTDSFGHRAVTTRKIAVGTGQGFRLLGEDGGVFGYGKRYFGSANELGLAAPIVGGAPTPSGLGYWLVGEDGGVFNYGDAGFFGSLGGMDLPSPIVGMAATPNGQGYWLATADGQVYRFGDAVFHGSMGGQQLNSPIVGIAAMPHGIGYWLVGADGGVFAYGNAGFFGSAGGLELNAPVVGMFASPSGDGYWLAASDGGVFDYGDAGFFGSAGSVDLVSPVVGIAPTPTGEGYWLAAADGGVFDYGDAGFLGSAAGMGLVAPISGIIAG